MMRLALLGLCVIVLVGCPAVPEVQPPAAPGGSPLAPGIYKGTITCDFLGEVSFLAPIQLTDDETQYSVHVGDSGLPELSGEEVVAGDVMTGNGITRTIDAVTVTAGGVVVEYTIEGADAEAVLYYTNRMVVLAAGDRTVDVHFDEYLDQTVSGVQYVGEQECEGVLSR